MAAASCSASYGSHLFPSNSDQVWRYKSRFTSFTNYRHHVWTRYAGRVFSLPMNLGTICSFFGRSFTPDEARAVVAQQAGELANTDPANLEEKAISLIGRPLYNALVAGYTSKQWQTDPRNLPAEGSSRWFR